MSHSPKTPQGPDFDMEVVAGQVHEAWMAAKRAQGYMSCKSEQGEELMRPYADLSEAQKDLDRATVRAVYAAIGLPRLAAAPERKGFGQEEIDYVTEALTFEPQRRAKLFPRFDEVLEQIMEGISQTERMVTAPSAMVGEMAKQASRGHKQFCVGAHQHENGEYEYEWVEWSEAFAKLVSSLAVESEKQAIKQQPVSIKIR